MKVGLAVALGIAAIAAAPFVASTYHVLLMLPFMAYAVVLLGLNLLFGYTGLVSFGHALFIGLGAYYGAFLTTHAKIRSLELILIAAAALGALVAVPIAALCGVAPACLVRTGCIIRIRRRRVRPGRIVSGCVA